MNQQDSDGSRTWKPPSLGGQSALSAATKQRQGFATNQLVKKDGSMGVLPTKPPVPKKKDLVLGPSFQLPQAQMQERSSVSQLNSKFQGEVAKFETRGPTSPLKTSPCSILQKTGARKLPNEGNSKMDASVSSVPQRSMAEIQQDLMEKFAQTQRAAKGIVTVSDKVPALPMAQKNVSETSSNIPTRKPLPSEKVLGPRPEKPRRPPIVNLDKFRTLLVNKTERCPATGNNLDRPMQKSPASSPLHYRAHQHPMLLKPSVPLPSTAEEHYDDAASIGTYNKGTVPSRMPKCLSPGRDEYYDDVEMIPDEFPPPPVNLCELQPGWKSEKDLKKRQKEENEFRKKFKFEGQIMVVTRMMVTPSAGVKKGGGKDLPFKKGEILDVIQLSNQEKIICRNTQGKFGYVPKRFLLQIEREIYDDVGIHDELYDDIELIMNVQPPLPPKPRMSSEEQELALKAKNEKDLIKAEKEEKDFRKKFKFEGEIRIVTRMMVTPSVGVKKGGGKDLPISGGEILDVIQIKSKDKVICRNTQGKYGYVKKNYLLQLELDIYDDVDN
ncbi:PML-RARA-regulated adapter molecule 1 isoform X2 [Microcaecilia unicolor]|nr:PML-RARA-regulated adapter molecule 1-like isoform X2 [Microcaecilia unicolor]